MKTQSHLAKVQSIRAGAFAENETEKIWEALEYLATEADIKSKWIKDFEYSMSAVVVHSELAT